jgi:hypothetical protein
MTPAELLRRSAARIRGGWCRGSFHNSHNEVCALGAMQLVAFGGAFAQSGPEAYAYKAALNIFAGELTKQFAVQIAHHPQKSTFVPDDAALATHDGRRSLTVLVNDHIVADGEDIATCMEKAAAKLEQA